MRYNFIYSNTKLLTSSPLRHGNTFQHITLYSTTIVPRTEKKTQKKEKNTPTNPVNESIYRKDQAVRTLITKHV